MRFCPKCGGDIGEYLAVEGKASAMTLPPASVKQEKYDQTATWRKLVAEAQLVMSSPPTAEALVYANRPPALKDGETAMGIVHLVFDRSVTPDGGILMSAMMTNGTSRVDDERLGAMGYALDDGGKILLVDDIPVGKAYGVLEYWGGAKQHKRWHMSEPVKLDPSRSGELSFMDENMVAFASRWKDFEKYDEAMMTLLEAFASGVKGGSQIAQPVAMLVVWQ